MAICISRAIRSSNEENEDDGKDFQNCNTRFKLNEEMADKEKKMSPYFIIKIQKGERQNLKNEEKTQEPKTDMKSIFTKQQILHVRQITKSIFCSFSTESPVTP